MGTDYNHVKFTTHHPVQFRYRNTTENTVEGRWGTEISRVHVGSTKKLGPYSKGNAISSISKDLGQFLLTATIVSLGRLSQEDGHKFTASMYYRISSVSQEQQQKSTNN